MQPAAHYDKIRIEHVKIHALVARISDGPQIHFEHTEAMTVLMVLIDLYANLIGRKPLGTLVVQYVVCDAS